MVRALPLQVHTCKAILYLEGSNCSFPTSRMLTAELLFLRFKFFPSFRALDIGKNSQEAFKVSTILKTARNFMKT